MRTAPLWALCSVNDEALPETTDPARAFEYVDISAVSPGCIDDRVEAMKFKDAPSRARRLVKAGDVVVSTVRTYLKAIARVDDRHAHSVFSTGFAVLRPIGDVCDSRYLAYVMTSDGIMDAVVAASVGVSYPAINASDLVRLRVPIHDLRTQRRIADYLDRETGEIDAMLAKLDEMVEVLNERRGSQVDVALASDGYIALRWLSESIDTGPFGTQVGSADYVEDGIPLINPSHIRDGRLVPNSHVSVSEGRASDLSRFSLQVGDLTVARRGEFGRCAVVRPPDVPALCGTGSLRVRPDRMKADARFLAYVIASRRSIRELELLAVGATMQNLNEHLLGALSVPRIDLAQQRRIADHLDEMTGRIDAMLEKVAKLKDLLTERRAALITEVVTGRKEV